MVEVSTYLERLSLYMQRPFARGPLPNMQTVICLGTAVLKEFAVVFVVVVVEREWRPEEEEGFE